MDGSKIDQYKLCGCGKTLANKGIDANGKTIYRSRCNSCRRIGRMAKKDHCERCSFVPEDLIQLDVDHIDGNPSNNEESNLQTLCANCHKLKTKLNQDWRKKNV